MPQTHGINYFTYGVPTMTGFVVESYDTKTKAALVIPIANESGVVITRRYDDITTNITINAVVGSGSAPTPGNTINYNGYYYEVEDVNLKGNNKQAQMITINGIYSQGIPLP